jgi:predicted phage terminase large subunit-like protein
MQSPAELKKLKMAKYKCLESLLFSTRYFFKHRFNRKYKVLPHHIQIAEALEKVLRGEITKLLIAVGPRLGKTEIAVKNFIANGLGLNPAAKFIHLAASDGLALDNSEGAMDIVKSPEYRRVFPEVQIKQNTDSKKKWYTTAGGGVYATGAAGQVTGFGAGAVDYGDEEEDDDFAEFITDIETKQGFGGAIIIDDSIKPEDADGDVKRERVNRRYTSTIQNRRNSFKTPIIVIQQRLHPKDLIGYLMDTEPGEWTIITLPTLYVDKNGELRSLDESIYPLKTLLSMQSSEDEEMRIFFERQLQQNPKPREGLMFPMEDLNLYNPATFDPKAVAEFRFAFIDPADEGGDDLSAPVGYLVGDKIYIPDVIYNKDGTDVNEPACVEFLKSHACEAVEVESNSAWILFAKNIRSKLQEDGSDCELRVIKNSTNKHVRILAQSAFIRKNFVFRKDWATCSNQYKRFMDNTTAYMKVQEGASRNKHDDAPDSLAGMASYFRCHFPDLWKVVTHAQG